MLKFIVTSYNKAATTGVNTITATITRIIMDDTILRFFLLFILNIFFTLLSYKTNNKLQSTERILYYEIPHFGKFSGLYCHRSNF